MLNEELADEVLSGLAKTVDGFNLEIRGRIMSSIQMARLEERNRIIKIIEDEQAFLTAGDKASLIEKILGLDT